MNHRRYISIVIACLALVLVRCSDAGGPENLIAHEDMVPVLADLQIAYVGVDQTVKDPKERQKRYQEMNQIVLKKHNLDHQTFYDSYQWYESDPVQLDTILKQVVQVLNDELNTLKDAEAAKPKAPMPK